MKRADSLQGFIVHNEVWAQKYKLIIPGRSPASWDPEIALRFEHGCFRFIVVREACDSGLVENAPHLDSPDEANKLRARRSKPCCPGCALMEGALWFSQLLFLRQFNQRRQAEDNRQFDYQKAKWYRVCGFANKRHWSCWWSPSRVGAKNKENCFIMLMKKRTKISIFLK